MTPKSELEIQGNFLVHPFAELLAEIAHARLNGSLRVSEREKKSVVYFKGGRVVFAVSNSRASRLYDILLRRNKVDKNDLAHIPNFSNDLEFAAFLQEKGFLTKTECNRLVVEQIESIIVDILAWPAGDWIFSSLARIRDGLSYDVDTTRLIVDYGRCMVVDEMLKRFRTLDESFRRSNLPEMGVALKTNEAFVLSRAAEAPLTAAGLATVAAMPEADALHAIYTLWLGGLLVREDWQPAFSPEAVALMRSAKLELKKEATPRSQPAPIVDTKVAEAVQAPPKAPEIEITLDEYLARVENSITHYDMLGIDPKAEVGEIKQAYFSLAKMFHPDKYHAEGGEVLQRVQNAFTGLAQAHETLKSAESREVYDYRMRKELADREKREAAGNYGNASLQAEQAAESFEVGFSLLMDENVEGAMPYLARAVHYAPKNARYRAYYGKALSFDEKQRHKAEGEIQAALKLDPNNPAFRIMLAEFFIQFNLLKRAEGELNRLLAIFPSNREAREMLASLKAA